MEDEFILKIEERRNEDGTIMPAFYLPSKDLIVLCCGKNGEERPLQTTWRGKLIVRRSFLAAIFTFINHEVVHKVCYALEENPDFDILMKGPATYHGLDE